MDSDGERGPGSGPQLVGVVIDQLPSALYRVRLEGGRQMVAHIADRIVTRSALPRDRLDHEAFLAEVEVRSEPAGSVAAAVGQLAEGRAEAICAGAEAAGSGSGATVMAVGLHPDARLFDVELVQSERYASSGRVTRSQSAKSTPAGWSTYTQNRAGERSSTVSTSTSGRVDSTSGVIALVSSRSLS